MWRHQNAKIRLRIVPARARPEPFVQGFLHHRELQSVFFARVNPDGHLHQGNYYLIVLVLVKSRPKVASDTQERFCASFNY